MRLFGLTGGLASGKSTVAARLRELGIPVIDADQLAREVVAPGTDGLSAVVAAFGADVLDASGALDRAKLASIVFSDPERRRTLNGILHPRIAALTATRAAELATQGHTLACYEAALLVENGLADAFRPLVVVAVPPEMQVARAMARDGATEEQARARLAAQLPLADKIRVADHVIDNSGDRFGGREQRQRALSLALALTAPARTPETHARAHDAGEERAFSN
jgi:dephospho-CoA kinase